MFSKAGVEQPGKKTTVESKRERKEEKKHKEIEREVGDI